jgi:hypothetical protein
MPEPSVWEIVFAPYVTGPVGLVGGVAFKHLKSRYWDVRGIRRTLAFLMNETILYLPLYAGQPGRGTVAGYGDMLAYADLHVAASKIGLQGRLESAVCQEAPLTPVEGKRNLVILGGGTANQYHINLISELQPPIHFWAEPGKDNKILRNEQYTIQFHPKVADECVTEDVGLVIFGTNPNKPESTVLICAGAYTYGTAAAMRYFLSDEGTRLARATLGRIALFAVTCKVKEQSPTDLKLVAHEVGPWRQ